MARPTAPARRTPLSERLRATSRQRPLVVGHRGAAATHPENTLASFAAALEAGAELIEFDVRPTQDGELVCLHDATLDRTTDARSRFGARRCAVAEQPLAALQQLDAGAWKGAAFTGERIPTLAAALGMIQPRAVAMIEHKGGEPERYVALLRRLGLLEQVLLQSFAWDWLAAVHALEPAITLGALGSRRFGPTHLRRLPQTGASFVHWAWDRLRSEQIEALHAAGHLLCVYTVDADLALRGAAATGIDMVTTNDPARMRRLAERGLLQRPA